VAQLEVARTAVDLTKANTAATLGQALAGVEQAKASVQAAKSQIDSAQADVAAAEAESALHDSELKRYESTDRSALTQMELDTARTLSSTSHSALTAARKRVGAAEANLVEAQARVTQREATVDAARTGPQQIATAEAQVRNAAAAVEEAKAAVNSAQLELSYTTIVAPWAGRVARKSVEPGQFLQAGQAMLALVGADVWVTANFKETQLTHMQAGQEVDIRVDAYPGKLLHGRVESIMGGTGARFSLLPPENATGNYVKVVQRLPVKIVFDWDSERHFLLAPGMSAEPRVHVGAGTMAHPAAICPTSRPVAK
jgi:membrane fusion protein (multidrug efflux system)